MKVELLPSSFGNGGSASQRQHLTCFLIDDIVSVDAGSLGLAASDAQRESVRDVVITHAHLDHIAGLPLFIDDLFSQLESPVVVYAIQDVIDILERDVFNWSVYPRFSELTNQHGAVMRYQPIPVGGTFSVKHLTFSEIEVNHKVPNSGFVIDDGSSRIALTGDTAEMDGFWDAIDAFAPLDALLIECAFPDEMSELADVSHHLTPSQLNRELEKFKQDCPIYAINLKPTYREAIVRQLDTLAIPRLSVMESRRTYEW
ncbi:MAG: 3',5'-cyclic-nucleotide phosphodiesterase [Blastocatellia bacterium]|nr:3',5'-cyclic-nucleotide phosphodiesterase [Blastocatellia bacterium]